MTAFFSVLVACSVIPRLAARKRNRQVELGGWGIPGDDPRHGRSLGDGRRAPAGGRLRLEKDSFAVARLQSGRRSASLTRSRRRLCSFGRLSASLRDSFASPVTGTGLE